MKQLDDDEKRIFYRWSDVGGLKIFYREAGDRKKPTLVLLHGFPSSSFMFRELIPKLSDKFHLIAADMPGFGYTDQPERSDFAYTFDNLAKVMGDFIRGLGIEKFSIYIQDYGSPVGLRIFANDPEQIEAIISQNGNAYEDGLSPFWDEYLRPFWKTRNAQTEAKVRDLLTFGSMRYQYEQGAHRLSHICPDTFHFDQMIMDRAGNKQIQLDLLYDYQNNIPLYPRWQEAIRKAKPPILAVWGKNDPIFLPVGAQAFQRDAPDAEVHLLDTGHFALEEESGAIANYITDFLNRRIRPF